MHLDEKYKPPRKANLVKNLSIFSKLLINCQVADGIIVSTVAIILFLGIVANVAGCIPGVHQPIANLLMMTYGRVKIPIHFLLFFTSILHYSFGTCSSTRRPRFYVSVTFSK
jgi:hypothetical protein